MEIRNFQLDTEWNAIHCPERPQGFGILIIGDEKHFVDEKTSYWMQNEGRSVLLKSLQDAGYTVFYSNLYGKNWGSDKSVQFAKRLYHHIIRKEILNEKIHLIAEGMGAIVALKLLQHMGESIRSIIFINPILSLNDHLELEKDHTFFYKKLTKEIALSYEKRKEDIHEWIGDVDAPTLVKPSVPIKIIHILSDNRAHRQSQLLNHLSQKWEKEEAPISVCYMVTEKRLQMAKPMIDFLKQQEEFL